MSVKTSLDQLPIHSSLGYCCGLMNLHLVPQDEVVESLSRLLWDLQGGAVQRQSLVQTCNYQGLFTNLWSCVMAGLANYVSVLGHTEDVPCST